MPIKAVTTECQGHTYKFNTLPATKGLEVFSLVMGLCGDALADLAGEVAKSRGMKVDPNQEDVVSAVGVENLPNVMEHIARSLFRGIAKPEFAQTVRALIGEVHKDNRPISDFDREFAGEYGVIFHLVFESIKANYSGFLGGGGVFAALSNLGDMTQGQAT